MRTFKSLVGWARGDTPAPTPGPSAAPAQTSSSTRQVSATGLSSRRATAGASASTAAGTASVKPRQKTVSREGLERWTALTAMQVDSRSQAGEPPDLKTTRDIAYRTYLQNSLNREIEAGIPPREATHHELRAMGEANVQSVALEHDLSSDYIDGAHYVMSNDLALQRSRRSQRKLQQKLGVSYRFSLTSDALLHHADHPLSAEGRMESVRKAHLSMLRATAAWGTDEPTSTSAKAYAPHELLGRSDLPDTPAPAAGDAPADDAGDKGKGKATEPRGDDVSMPLAVPGRLDHAILYGAGRLQEEKISELGSQYSGMLHEPSADERPLSMDPVAPGVSYGEVHGMRVGRFGTAHFPFGHQAGRPAPSYGNSRSMVVADAVMQGLSGNGEATLRERALEQIDPALRKYGYDTENPSRADEARLHKPLRERIKKLFSLK